VIENDVDRSVIGNDVDRSVSDVGLSGSDAGGDVDDDVCGGGTGNGQEQMLSGKF